MKREKIIALTLTAFITLPFAAALQRDVPLQHGRAVTVKFGAPVYAGTAGDRTADNNGGKKDISPAAMDDSVTLMKVMAIILVIWGGISLYLVSIDRKLKKLEEKINER